MRKNTLTTRKLTAAAIAAALIFAVTWLIKFPVPVSGGAYLHFGDAVIYSCAYILGGPLGALSAALGSALADVTGGAAVYALPTLVIKGAVGFAAGALNKKRTFGFYALASFLGGGIMTAGYALFEYAVFGAAYALASLPFNLFQWGVSAALALAFYSALKRVSVYLENTI